MIARDELRRVARARLRDALVLLDGRRYEAATYICGYAIELTLKARICTTLRWREFPETRKEFERYSNLRTHDLEVLLQFSGRKDRVLAKHLREWLRVAFWTPEVRYARSGTTTKSQALEMIHSARALVRAL